MSKLRRLIYFVIFPMILFCNCRICKSGRNCELKNINDSLIFFLRVDSTNKDYFNFYITQDDTVAEVSFTLNKALEIEQTVYSYLCLDSFYSKEKLFLDFRNFKRQYLGVSNNKDSFVYILYSLLPKDLKYDQSERTWNYSFAFFLHTKGAYQYLVGYSVKNKKIIRVTKFQ